MKPNRPASSSAIPALPFTLLWRVALVFLAISACVGALLRYLSLHPVPGLDYAHLLHAHSHVAFLGWVFNACFAIALACFGSRRGATGWLRLWAVLQIGVVGMLISYPTQGYGAISIAFSTLHMGATAVFAWWFWRSTPAIEQPAVRAHLRVALLALVLSGLGPLALGPLAAADLRESPAYTLSIYFYLHAHYNGWFVFFLQAVALQLAGSRVDETRARRAAHWLAGGLVLTFAQSTLWLNPPGGVTLLAGIGGGLQLVGAAYLLAALRPAWSQLGTRALRWLVGIAVLSWGLKLLLQALAVIPDLAPLAFHRFVAIAFLHLVFLGVVTPALLAVALHRRWLRPNPTTHLLMGLFFGAAVVGQLVLVAIPLGFFPLSWNPLQALAWPAALSAVAAVGLCFQRAGRE